LLRAARGGEKIAQFTLGANYLHGYNGMPQKKSQALIWLQKAVAQDYEPAIAMLATLY